MQALRGWSAFHPPWSFVFFKRPTGCQRLRPPASDSSPVAASPSSFFVHEPTPSLSPLPSSPTFAVAVTVTSPQAPSLANRGPRPFHHFPSVEVVRQLCFRRGEGTPEPPTSGNRSSLTSPTSRQRPRVPSHDRAIPHLALTRLVWIHHGRDKIVSLQVAS
jgi:hypothetical protein